MSAQGKAVARLKSPREIIGIFDRRCSATFGMSIERERVEYESHRINLTYGNRLQGKDCDKAGGRKCIRYTGKRRQRQHIAYWTCAEWLDFGSPQSGICSTPRRRYVVNVYQRGMDGFYDENILSSIGIETRIVARPEGGSCIGYTATTDNAVHNPCLGAYSTFRMPLTAWLILILFSIRAKRT